MTSIDKMANSSRYTMPRNVEPLPLTCCRFLALFETLFLIFVVSVRLYSESLSKVVNIDR